MDCSLRNVSVRLKEPKPLDVDMNVENLSSRMPYNSSIEDKNNGIGETHLSIECDEKLSMISDVSEEVRDKLHIGCTSASNTNTGLLNGCSKMLYEDVKGVDFTKNGLTKHHNLDLINTHLDCYNSEKLCAENVKMCTIETPRTDKSNVEAELNFDDCKSECVAKSESNSVGETISNAINTNSSVSEIEHEVLNNTYEYPSSSLCIGSCIGGANRDMHITYLGYDSESQMPDIMRLIQKDLSEPYSIYTYRYFIHNWPKLCFLAQDAEKCVGAIVCKLDIHKKHSRRGYIAMLAVDEKYRKRKIGSNLVLKAIKAMVQDNADEVVLETEITNKPALRLYENLGFVRDKRLFRYYLNGVDALRLKLWLR